MQNNNRRNFLKDLAAGGIGLAFAGLGARLDFARRASAFDKLGPYGAISPKAALNTGEVFLALPEGFQYNVIARAGSPMTNGSPTPILHDGMTVIQSGSRPGQWIVIRNHENGAFAGSEGAVKGAVPYDAAAAGGTTTLIVNRQTRLLTEDFVSLSGTVRNCAGGVTPWRSWISCEETTVGVSNGFQQPHGYCFEVPRSGISNAVALTAMGRFRHEAVAFDPRSGIAYLTEDNTPSGFYRFLPNAYGNLAAGGKLQMLAVSGSPGYDTRTSQIPGRRLIVEWVNIAEPNTPAAETNSLAVFAQGAALGGATFSRLEGCFAGVREVYFTSTNGGNAGFGQLWKYEPRPKSNFGYLTLEFESPSASVFDFPDNICFGPRGNLFVCEDGTTDNYVRILKRDGELSAFAKNIVPGFESLELTGGVFSPDFSTFFINTQTPGLTFAIWGPW